MATAHYACERCGTSDSLFTHFMLTDDLWRASGFQRFGCLRCVREHLNRPLVAADFQEHLYCIANTRVVERAAVTDANTAEAEELRTAQTDASLALFAKRKCPVCAQQKYGVRARRLSTQYSNKIEDWIMSCEQCFLIIN